MTVLFFTVSHRGSISLPAAAPLISRYLYRKTNPVSAIESSLFTILCFFPTSQYQPHHLLYGICHIPSGSYRLHSFLDCNRLPQDGEEGIYAVLITHPGLPGYATGKGYDRLIVPLGNSGYPNWGFAHNRLPVQAAFPCNDKVSLSYMTFEIYLIQHNVYARFQGSIHECAKRKSQSSSGSTSGSLWIGTRIVRTPF